MNKKFVPLNSERVPGVNPYQVRTWEVPAYRRNSTLPETSAIPHASQLIISRKPSEESIRKIIKKQFFTPLQKKYPKTVKKTCTPLDPYPECVRILRNPQQLKKHADAREKIIEIREQISPKAGYIELRNPPTKYDLIKFTSPTDLGNMKKASPSPSMDVVYVPSRKLLDLKKPKSGTYLNELPYEEGYIPYQTYDPRTLQDKLNREEEIYEIYNVGGEEYARVPEPKSFIPECCCHLFYPKDWTLKPAIAVIGKDKLLDLNIDLDKDYISGNKPKELILEFKQEQKYPGSLVKTGDPKSVKLKDQAIIHSPKQIPKIPYKQFNLKFFGEYRIERTPPDEVKSRQQPEIALLYAAFAYNFIKPVCDWNMPIFCQIEQIGRKIYDQCARMEYKNLKSDFDIDHRITIKKIPVTISCTKPSFVGKLTGVGTNLSSALHDFFREKLAAIFTCENTFLLIWKECKRYYVFDPNGRDKDTLVPDDKLGRATLIACPDLFNVANFILLNSKLNFGETFRLYEISIVKYNVTHEKLAIETPNKLKRHYTVVNEYYAVVRASDGIPPLQKPARNASMLTACLARIYADIDPARFWTQNIIDQLRKYINAIFLKQCKAENLKKYTIENLPVVHRLGSYRAEIKITPYFTSGQVNKCDTFRTSQLVSALCSLLEKHDTGLVQIDASTMVVWRDLKFFYVFDPFRRSPTGMYIPREQKGGATLQLHMNLKSLCMVFYNNAREMAPKGNFFIHALEIVKTRVVHHTQLKTEKDNHPLLLLDYPLPCEKETKPEKTDDSRADSFIKNVPQNCLSVLSVSPCERACSETDLLEAERTAKAKLKKMLNLTTRLAQPAAILPESQKLTWYDSFDVVQPIIEDILKANFKKLKERSKYDGVPRARKVLLKSDQEYLQGLMRRVERGDDYDNLYVEYPRSQNVYEYALSLEEELKLETSFELMPDGGWIVNGKIRTTISSKDPEFGTLSAFVALIAAGKYNVKFWNSKLLDYIVETARTLQSSAKIPKNVTKFLLNPKMPNIGIAGETFEITVKQVATGEAIDTLQLLEKGFKRRPNLLLVYNTFSCAVFKRNVFYFLFIGLPCDLMGFRCNNTGVPSLMRSLDLESIVRRIHANRNNTTDLQKAIIFTIHTREVTDEDSPFIKRTESDDDLWYAKEKDSLERKKSRRQMKVLFLRDELAKEKLRIQLFKREKIGREEYYPSYEGEEGMSEEEEVDILPEPKHRPGEKLPDTDPFYFEKGEKIRRKPILGYVYYKPDYNFKIQGTTGLENRKAGNINTIRPCHFAAMYAVMYAIHRPLEKWDFRRVDIVIESGVQLDNSIKEKKNCISRTVKNIRVDDYVYDLDIKKYELSTYAKSLPIEKTIEKVAQTKKYFLLQFENASFAVFKDAHYHLFDPYNTLETITAAEGPNKPLKVKGVKPTVDRNTASWIIFPDVNYMLTYIQQRMTSDNWKNSFNLYIINILNMRKGSKKDRLAQSLVDSPIDAEIEEQDDKLVEMQTERVTWIEMFQGAVPWSPLREFNINNEKRGTSHTKWKSFDVEMPGKLYSLWGNIHPRSAMFEANRGKQYLAICVISCCMAHIYHVEEWTPNIPDSIVVYGDKYFTESTADIKAKDYEVTLEDLNTEFSMGKLCKFMIHLESVVYGLLYETKPKMFNLSRALSYFFLNHRYGIVQCMGRCLCFGKTKTGYFMFDCQTYGEPMFQANQGCAYVLFAPTLDMLLYCLTVTLRVPYYNIEFVIHSVRIGLKKDSDAEAGPSKQTNTAPESKPAPTVSEPANSAPAPAAAPAVTPVAAPVAAPAPAPAPTPAPAPAPAPET